MLVFQAGIKGRQARRAVHDMHPPTMTGRACMVLWQVVHAWYTDAAAAISATPLVLFIFVLHDGRAGRA